MRVAMEVVEADENKNKFWEKRHKGKLRVFLVKINGLTSVDDRLWDYL
jgi:hypothetical protein